MHVGNLRTQEDAHYIGACHHCNMITSGGHFSSACRFLCTNPQHVLWFALCITSDAYWTSLELNSFWKMVWVITHMPMAKYLRRTLGTETNDSNKYGVTSGTNTLCPFYLTAHPVGTSATSWEAATICDEEKEELDSAKWCTSACKSACYDEAAIATVASEVLA